MKAEREIVPTRILVHLNRAQHVHCVFTVLSNQAHYQVFGLARWPILMAEKSGKNPEKTRLPLRVTMLTGRAPLAA